MPTVYLSNWSSHRTPGYPQLSQAQAQPPQVSSSGQMVPMDPALRRQVAEVHAQVPPEIAREHVQQATEPLPPGTQPVPPGEADRVMSQAERDYQKYMVNVPPLTPEQQAEVDAWHAQQRAKQNALEPAVPGNGGGPPLAVVPQPDPQLEAQAPQPPPPKPKRRSGGGGRKKPVADQDA